MVSMTGSVESSFDRNWASRKESLYNHWTPGTPRNQIQLAFRRHWITFQPYIQNLPGNEVLEIGCGRGTISSYFGAAGFDVTLLDSSRTVIDIAKAVYNTNGHAGTFVVGDAFRLPFDPDRFSVCVSIGLLEHFDDVAASMREQLRVLKPQGVMLAYVVPEGPSNIQRHFDRVNRALKALADLVPRRNGASAAPGLAKEEVYRNALTAEDYLSALRRMGVKDAHAHGMYPVPMISHSPEFPFSLLPPPLERVLVGAFGATLRLRRLMLRKDPWTCQERNGQAFLVVAKKPAV